MWTVPTSHGGQRTGDKASLLFKAILWLGPPWLKAESEEEENWGEGAGLDLIQF